MAKLIDILGFKGTLVDIVPTTKGLKLTEVWNKEGEYLFQLIYVKHKNKLRWVMVDLDKDFQVSLDCVKEAFAITSKYWKVA